MRHNISWLLILILVLVIGGLAYFLGKKNGTKTIDQMVMNQVLVQQIAELSSLEVRGNASIKSSNIADNGTITDNFKKLFLEKTLNINVPYVAKYGIDVGKQKINIEENNKQVYIVLPVPQLLSYELRLDQANAMSRKGLFETSDEEMYNKVIQKLYSQSRARLDSNNTYKEQAKEKIRKIIRDYYAPLNMQVDISFSEELRSKIIDQPAQ